MNPLDVVFDVLLQLKKSEKNVHFADVLRGAAVLPKDVVIKALDNWVSMGIVTLVIDDCIVEFDY